MDGSGVVQELAIVGKTTLPPLAATELASVPVTLLTVGDFFTSSGGLIPLTIDHELDVNVESEIAEQLCLDLGILAVGTELHAISEAAKALSFGPAIYPAANVVFNVPLNPRMKGRTQVLLRFSYFNPALRVCLGPHFIGQATPPRERIRVVGLRINCPPGIAEIPMVQDLFFCLLGHAARLGLSVLINEVDAIEDFNWLRHQPNLLFQGDALSIPLSLEYVEKWLEAESCWQDFRLATTATRCVEPA